MTRSGYTACRRSSIPLTELPGMAGLSDKLTFTGYLRRSLPSAPSQASERELPDKPYVLVTTGGGGDGEELIDWVLSAYEADPQHPASRAARVRPVHAPRAAARFPGARGAARTRLYDHLRCPLRAAGRRGDRRGRDGRLQHLLRDPVVRQAGADRAAHRAASGAVPACGARRVDSAWCACCPTTACGRRGAWPSSCMRWPAGRGRGREQIPGLLGGLERITERAAPWLDLKEQPLPRSA